MKTLVPLLALALLLSACGGHKDAVISPVDTLSVLTGPAGGSWDSLGVGLRTAFADARYALTTRNGGGVANIPALAEGRADLALSMSFLTYQAQSGGAPYDTTYTGMRVLANLYPQYLYALVKESYARQYNISTFRELFADHPLRLALLPRGSAGEFLAVRAIEACGATIAGVTMRGGVAHMDYQEGVDKLLTSNVDAFIFTLSAPSQLIRDLTCRDEFVFLPMDGPLLQTMHDQCGTIAHTLPAGLYDDLDSDVRVIGDYTCLLARADMPDSTAHALAGALMNHWDDLCKDADMLPAQNTDEIFCDLGFPLHPGAKRFAEELKKQAAPVGE